MPDYSLGKIYKITAKNADEGDVYIGSTIQPLECRLSQHKHIDNCSTSKLLINKYGKDNIYIELVKKFPCENRQQLEKEEGRYILEITCVNRCIAGRTRKEYYQEHKEEKKEYDIKYREDNNDRIKYNKKIYYDLHQEQITDDKKIYYDLHREDRKKYNEDNKERFKEYRKKYNEDNKERRLIKIECPICKRIVSKVKLAAHNKTKVHLSHINISESL